MDTLASWLCIFGKFNKLAFSSLLLSPGTQNWGWATVGSSPLPNPVWAAGLEGWEMGQFTMPALRTDREQNGKGENMVSEQRDYMEEPQKNILPPIWLQSWRNKTSGARAPGCLSHPQNPGTVVGPLRITHLNGNDIWQTEHPALAPCVLNVVRVGEIIHQRIY